MAKKKINTKVYVFDLDDTLYMHIMHKPLDYHKKVKKFMKKIKDTGKKIAIATHNLRPESLLSQLDIKDLIDVVIKETRPVNSWDNTIDEYTPKSDMLREIMSILKCKKKHMLFFDDSPYNIKKVRDFKVKSILVNPVLGIDFENIISH